eukprot:g9044.t1
MEDQLDAVVFGTYFLTLSHSLIRAHVGMRNRMERTLLAQYQRLPGLQSSFVGLEAHLDIDETLEFEDFLNRKELCPTPDIGFNHTMHDVLEKKLGLK